VAYSCRAPGYAVLGMWIEFHDGRLCVYQEIPALHSLAHRLHNLTVVLRSTQPSTLRGTVEWVSAFELRLSDNKIMVTDVDIIIIFKLISFLFLFCLIENE